jgi:hypothetical protein
MDFRIFLQDYGKNLTTNDVIENKMLDYNYFYEFIKKHYDLNHIKKHNYLKYVKITRQKIVFNKESIYENLVQHINDIFQKMFHENVLCKMNLRKYFFKLSKIYTILEKKKKNFQELIQYYKLLMVQYEFNKPLQVKLLCSLNLIQYKYQLFLKLSRQLNFYLQQFIELEEKNDIEHKLIEINNMERTLLGKKSEYYAETILKKYCKLYPKYIYIQNIDFIKLLKLPIQDVHQLKGEIDGLLLYQEDKYYYIEYMIEVKSSIKSIYEDIHKFVHLKKIIESIDEDDEFHVPDSEIILHKKSFQKIIHQPISGSILYLCTNNVYKNKIEICHFYFLYVLKIIDQNFIEKYYLQQDESIIYEKYQKIIDHQDYIYSIFNEWKKNVNLNEESSCIYLL